jgi:hypothetical protein
VSARRKPRPPAKPGALAQYEVFPTFGKWFWWIRGPDGTIIAKALRALSDQADCLADIESVRGAGNAAPVVFLNEGKSK